MDAKQIKEEFLTILDLLIQAARKQTFKEDADLAYIEGQILKGCVDGVPLYEEINEKTFYNDHVSFSHDNKFIKIKVSSCLYRIENTYHCLLLLRKKINAISTSSKPYDWHINKPSLKPKGISLDTLQADAWIDFENLYCHYRNELNLEKCAEMLSEIKEEMPELYQRIKDNEKQKKEYLVESYEWAFNQLNEKTPELSKWEQIIHSIDKREITLKSLTGEIRGCRVPSYNDLKEYVNRIRQTVCNYYDITQRKKKEMQLFYPDLYNEMFNLEQAA
jgi:hypothetical protein